MRILQSHADFIEFEPTQKEIKLAEDVERKKYRYEDVVVLFVSVEEGDNEAVGRKAIDDVKEFLSKVKGNKILVYPFAHLSRNLSKPVEALNIIKAMETYAKSLNIEAHRAVFGWTKQLHIKVKGHPLAETAKIYSPEEVEVKGKGDSEAIKAEEKVKSTWYILDQTGKLVGVDKFDFSKHRNLEKFSKYEISKVRAAQQIPPHVTLMKKLEIADFEPGSDPGNLRYYPKGRLLKSLIETFVTEKVVEYGGMEVETPLMYDYEHPAFVSYLNRFPARHYVLKSDDKEFFLRFSACFGQFLIAHDSQISYKDLPFKIYELTRYRFRREKSGEITGLRRLRSFTMPDMHTMCKDMEQSKKEFVNQFKFSMEVLKGLGFDANDYEVAVRFTEEFWRENEDFVLSLVNMVKKPVLIETWNMRYAYFDPKFEFNFVDALDKASALSTVQIDHENSERYDITYVAEDGEKKYPKILHCSPSGAVERIIYALLEKAHLDEKDKKVPQLPFWLSPVQIRVIPLSDKFVKDSVKIADELENNNIRVDVDDRDATIQKKIRDGELEWVPIMLVVGEKEIKSKKVSVRTRGKKELKQMKLGELIKDLVKEMGNKPYKKLPLPKLLSKRPIFVG